ncbi:sensor histidine kinase [Salipaludibacillus sp. CF4.18]|uniref:sensor histidine kinase n=1 Tax=Salipaludibacillus sp. CF4.18 TaxID=3373081 RepID=UPI003EE6CD16
MWPFLKKQPTKNGNTKTQIELNQDKSLDQTEGNQSTDDYHKAIGKMSAFFAHEIRNPLTSIIGFTQVLERDETVKSDPNVSNYISIIKDEALKMELLIQELLSLSNTHLHQDNLSIIDVKLSINKVIHLFEMNHSFDHVSFSSQTTDETYITGNETRFERVLTNMFNNSIEAFEDNKGKIDITLTKNDDYVNINILDNGPGIAEEHIDQIFFPFYTTKDEGTGIGLPICKAIIETLNGTLEIENNQKLPGTHVIMRLPASKHTYYRN